MTKPVRDLAILTFVTLDGVMQVPAQPDEDVSGGFTRGGWAMPYWEEVMAQVGTEAMAEPYDLLLGRKTYELFARHFTSAEGDQAHLLNQARKYLATNKLDGLEWNNSVAVSDDVAAKVGRLKAQDGPLLQVYGSWQLIQTLLANNLVDEFQLWTSPFIVGPGKRLFGETSGRPGLKLVKSGRTAKGFVMSIYRLAEPSGL